MVQPGSQIIEIPGSTSNVYQVEFRPFSPSLSASVQKGESCYHEMETLLQSSRMNVSWSMSVWGSVFHPHTPPGWHFNLRALNSGFDLDSLAMADIRLASSNYCCVLILFTTFYKEKFKHMQMNKVVYELHCIHHSHSIILSSSPNLFNLYS